MKNGHIDLKEKIASSSKAGGKKILFANVPADGHFNPLTALAKHLQTTGYDVRWYSSSTYEARVKKLQIPFYGFKKAFEVTGENIDSLFPERAGIKSKIKKLNFDIVNFFTLRGPEYYTDISEIYSTFPFDMVIADCAFSAIPMIKEKMNVPVISIGVMPLFQTSKDLPPSGLGLTPSYSLAGKIKQSFLRYFINKVLFKTSNKVMNKVLSSYNISNEGSGVFDIMAIKADLILQSGSPGFEYYRSDLGKNVRFIGPLLPYKENKRSEQWFDNRLLKYQKIILVTQGTLEKDTEKIIVPALEAFKDTDTLVVATTGGSQTKELRERFPQKNLVIEDYIPFDDIMPYASVFVSNGGYGGVMLAMQYQLPMVVAGIHEGKNEINARIGYFRLGINLNTETPAPAAIKLAAEKVMSNEVYRQNIIDLGKELAGYDPCKLCEQYVTELLGPETRNNRMTYILN